MVNFFCNAFCIAFIKVLPPPGSALVWVRCSVRNDVANLNGSDLVTFLTDTFEAQVLKESSESCLCIDFLGDEKIDYVSDSVNACSVSLRVFTLRTLVAFFSIPRAE